MQVTILSIVFEGQDNVWVGSSVEAIQSMVLGIPAQTLHEYHPATPAAVFRVASAFAGGQHRGSTQLGCFGAAHGGVRLCFRLIFSV